MGVKVPQLSNKKHSCGLNVNGSTYSHIRGLQLVMLLWKVVEPSGGKAPLEEMGHRETGPEAL